ncbi:MAG: hypothetical protein ACFFFT_17410 [Candidatus Thorarchaeota archaeon]
MGRRRRRVVKIVKKKLPKVFECPKCGENTIRVTISRESKLATVQCGSCGIKEEFQISKSNEEIDVYCLFTDKIHKQ